MDQSLPSTSLPPKQPRRWRRRILLALLFFILIGGGGILYFAWTASSALDAAIAETDRLDPGWRLEDIEAKRKVVPDAENSALQILAVKKLQGGQGVWTQGMQNVFGVDQDIPPQVQLNEKQISYLKKRFEVLQKAVLEARKLKDMPDGHFPIKFSEDFVSTIGPMATNYQAAREIADLLRWDAARRGQDSDAAGSLESCLALLHVARSMGDEPFIIAQLVHYACVAVTLGALERTLAQGQFTQASEVTLKNMQSTLARELQDQTFLSAMRGERAGSHRFLQAMADGKAKTLTKGVPPALMAKGSVLLGDLIEAALMDHFPGYLTRQHAALLHHYNILVEALKLPPEEREGRILALEKNQSGMVRTLMPGLMKFREAERRTQANLCCAMAALAAERFRIAQNRWPDSWAVLVESGFLEAIPIDPYDGKFLRFKRLADGLVIYSVGADRIDNDGNIDRNRPGAPGTDWGFRLWDVSRRRQPPK